MKNIALWFLLALIWSGSYGAIKVGIETIAPLPLVAGRMVIGAVVMFAILKFRSGSLSRNWRIWFTYGVSGMMGSALPFFLISYGEMNVDSGLAAIFMGITPVATVLVAPLILSDEEWTVSSFGGVFVGIFGLALLVGPSVLSGIGDDVGAQMTIIAAALCYAFTTIYVRRYATRPALEMAAGSMIVGAVVFVLATLVFDDPVNWNTPSTNSLLAMGYLGLFSTALATLLYFYLVARLGATRMSQVNFAVPVGGALIGVLVFGETLEPTAIVALAVIMVAIYLVTRNSSKGVG